MEQPQVKQSPVKHSYMKRTHMKQDHKKDAHRKHIHNQHSRRHHNHHNISCFVQTRPQIAQALWDTLWQTYRDRVPYARQYETMILEAEGTVANDHIAFRTLGMGIEGARGVTRLGIAYLEPLIQWLGYEQAGEYHFPDRHLYARHYRHPQQDEFNLPKLFISELLVDELPPAIAAHIYNTVNTGRFFSLADWPPYQRQTQSALSQPLELSRRELEALVEVFSRPWQPPRKQVVEAVNAVSQYGAWVLLHGYAVNHFTGFINCQNTSKYPDIASTVEGLKARGVPMKPTLEGSFDSGLQQITTKAVTEPVWVITEDGWPDEITWSYAYYELAQRHLVTTPTGETTLFEGFIGPQAKHLFEMTKVT